MAENEKLKGLTLQIPEKLHTRLKVKAATEGTTVKAIVIRGIESQVKRKKRGGPENDND